MKQYMYTLVFGLMLSACTHSEDPNTVISVLEDTTETHFVATPDAENIIARFGLEKDLWRSATFRYGRINSLIHNSRYLVRIEQENALLGNELKRKRLVNIFHNGVRLLLDSSKDSIIYKHSSIWLPIVEELELLQKMKNSRIKLFVFSDLQENSKFFSVFKTADIDSLEHQSDALVELFLSKSKVVAAADNIEVVIVYQPRTVAEDELFQKLKRLYKQLFSRLGISIKFTASLNGIN